MPGPGPRGPCETYRAPCSRFEDSRISARNPRKTGKSRRPRRTRTRQPGTSSTRDGLLCGENRSAADATRPSIPGPRSPCLSNRDANTAILDQLAVLDPGQCLRARPQAGFFCPFLRFLPKIAKKPQNPVAQSGANFQQKIADWRISASFVKKNLDRVARSAPAAERNPAHRSPDRAGAPVYRVRSVALDHRIRARDPPGPHAPSRLQGPCF